MGVGVVGGPHDAGWLGLPGSCPDENCQCPCKTGYTGRTCDSCDSGYEKDGDTCVTVTTTEAPSDDDDADTTTTAAEDTTTTTTKAEAGTTQQEIGMTKQ